MSYDDNLFEILINEVEKEEFNSRPPKNEKIIDIIRSHLKKYMKDYIAYAFWIILLFVLVLTLGKDYYSTIQTYPLSENRIGIVHLGLEVCNTQTV